VIRPLVGVAPEYLEAALDEMRRQSGTIEGYFTQGLKVDQGAQDALRAAFVERA
jgi:protein-tyrosine phosphatase